MGGNAQCRCVAKRGSLRGSQITLRPVTGEVCLHRRHFKVRHHAGNTMNVPILGEKLKD